MRGGRGVGGVGVMVLCRVVVGAVALFVDAVVSCDLLVMLCNM